jgi:predicted permease
MDLRTKLITVPLAVKLVVLPVTVACLTLWFSLPHDVARVVLMQSAMPTLTIASILFAKCGADEELAVVTTVISTAVSAATIPAAVLWLVS